eukprot:416805_1
MSNMSWISNISSTIMGRDRLSCIVHPIRKRLFAIGGSSMRSIESLYIGDDQDISTQIWEYLEVSLSDAGLYGVHSPSKRSAVYEDDIWVFGGYNYRDMGGRDSRETYFSSLTSPSLILYQEPYQMAAMWVMDPLVW